MTSIQLRLIGALLAMGGFLLAAKPLQGQEKPPAGNIFDFGRGAPAAGGTTTQPPSTKPPTTRPAAPGRDGPAANRPPAGDLPVIATAIQIVADDFVADIYHNGKLVPAEHRKLRGEVFGAQLEKVTLDLKPGDWVVFNVVNNRLRWNGSYYFAASVVNADGLSVFCSQASTGDWSTCNDLAGLPKFISDPRHLSDQRPTVIVEKRWGRGDKEMTKICPDFAGDPIWGNANSRSTWIKFVVPAGK